MNTSKIVLIPVVCGLGVLLVFEIRMLRDLYREKREMEDSFRKRNLPDTNHQKRNSEPTQPPSKID